MRNDIFGSFYNKRYETQLEMTPRTALFQRLSSFKHISEDIKENLNVYVIAHRISEKK